MDDRVYALVFDLSKFWNGLQGFDCDYQHASCLAELCERIRENRDSQDMLPGLQDHSYSNSYSKNAESDFRFLS
uniref:Uncharacterized protein n=1 Tax=Brassica campestris TaxID=3711 RepID=A0A3P6ATE2_BRACM|nr:unnamed protein product [Brassica rapa]